MFEALAKQNRTAAALACIARPGYPGFHYEIYNEYEPSTSLWESWNVNTQTCITCETSRDHHYRASINTFLRKYVAGLDMKPGASGWSTVLVRPEAAHTAVPSASASIESHRGTVAAAWVRSSDSFVLNVSIPHGSSAEVHVPKVFAGGTVVTEGGAVVSGGAGDAARSASDGVVQTGEDERWVRFSTLSGRYSFAATSHFNGARLVAPEDRHTRQQEAAMKNDDCPRTELRRECLQWRPSQLFGFNEWLPTPIHNQTFTRRLATEFPGASLRYPGGYSQWDWEAGWLPCATDPGMAKYCEQYSNYNTSQTYPKRVYPEWHRFTEAAGSGPTVFVLSVREPETMAQQLDALTTAAQHGVAVRYVELVRLSKKAFFV